MATVSASIEESIGVSCAVEVFLATAHLHRKNPDRRDFTIQEIVNQAAAEKMNGTLRLGIHVHASQHCVANKAPNPSKHRMLFATGKHTRRLALPSDIAHEERTGKIFPDIAEVPERYLPLLDWAKNRFEDALDAPDFWAEDADERVRQLRSDSLMSIGYTPTQPKNTPKPQYLRELIAAKGIGIEMAKGTDLRKYVREMREGWE